MFPGFFQGFIEFFSISTDDSILQRMDDRQTQLMPLFDGGLAYAPFVKIECSEADMAIAGYTDGVKFTTQRFFKFNQPGTILLFDPTVHDTLLINYGKCTGSVCA